MRVTASVVACLVVVEGFASVGCGGNEPCPAAPVASVAPPPVVAAAPPPPPAPAPAAPPPAPALAPTPVQTDALAGEAATIPLVNDVTTAMANIVTPDAIPQTWANRVGSPTEAFKAKWEKLVPGGHPDVVATLLDVGSVTTQPGVHAEVQTKLIVLGDGRVRYSTIAARDGKSVDANPTPDLATTEPAVATLLQELMTRLATGPCQVPFLTGEELLSLPEPVRGELGADLPSVASACAVVRKQKDATWAPILEAAVVILKHADAYVAVAAHFHTDKESGKLVLQPMAVVPVTGKSMELVWAGESSPAPKAKAGPAPSAPPPHAK